ncbi:MAG: hypothetical protein COV60_00260 [Candidatus Magasanikbacteria bacterium CG11_big_fil_rev_8_21_14_0_20_43_7]|uniref:Uncharacterized protein n=1 Tax=Candidatus Magasanikbacteria bacterium CG11_big_fil_rev_8_21_14_0_20_43_7 TaxID=1974654 RepID=A0A2H0N5S1_9BACT|nr:MAG: hypothetical protein COV60_00260 [Candidatus Magasanikbacteria bacterium CG11_big_fil_rev_8_21_14_0_20_43_7]
MTPFLIEAKDAHERGIVRYDEQGDVHITPPAKETRVVPLSSQFDLTQATIFGLNERLTSAATSPVMDESGTTLRELFEAEWEIYSVALENTEGPAFDYGWYAWYERQGHLVRYAPAFWHRVVSVASASTLLLDPEKRLRWQDVRKIYEETVIGVVGCSVGNAIVHASVMDMRPRSVKVADKSLYKMENINRVRLRYDDIVSSQEGREDIMSMGLRKKATVVADQLASIDPFLEIYVYEDGIQQEHVPAFFDGVRGEPALDILVEEVDEPRIKLLLREEARVRGIPVVMASDLGSMVQLDILRYDLDRTLPLTYGSTDDALRASVDAVYDHPGDRDVFFSFVDTLVGGAYRQDELERIVNLDAEIPTATIIPQLGSTATAGAGLVAETIARIRLGYPTPARVRFNKKMFTLERIV